MQNNGANMNAKTKLKKNKARTAFIYISIAYPLLHFLVFNIGMNLGMVYNSFFQENLIGEKIYCGFYQYADVFKSFTGLKDQGGMYTYRAVLNTFSLIPLSLIVNMPLSLLFAYAVFRKYALYRSFRVVLFVPAVISAVVLCLSFQMALDVNYGFIALLFKKMGIRVPVYGYFGHEKVAWWSILVFSVWTGISTNLVYFCSAMGRLPASVIESVQLDGATEWTVFGRIVVPMVWPTVVTISITLVAGAFGWYMPSLFLTNGKYSTATLGLIVIQNTQGNNHLGFTSALGVYIAIIGTAVTLLFKWGLNKFGSQEEY